MTGFAIFSVFSFSFISSLIITFAPVKMQSWGTAVFMKRMVRIPDCKTMKCKWKKSIKLPPVATRQE